MLLDPAYKHTEASVLDCLEEGEKDQSLVCDGSPCGNFFEGLGYSLLERSGSMEGEGGGKEPQYSLGLTQRADPLP